MSWNHTKYCCECLILWQEQGEYLPLSFYQEGEQLKLLEKGPSTIEIECPVRIFHGMEDAVVPSTCSTKLLECLKTTDAHATLIKVWYMTPWLYTCNKVHKKIWRPDLQAYILYMLLRCAHNEQCNDWKHCAGWGSQAVKASGPLHNLCSNPRDGGLLRREFQSTFNCRLCTFLHEAASDSRSADRTCQSVS